MSPAEPERLDVEVGSNPLDQEQPELLLKTKLFIPPVRSNRVPRPRLFDQINHGLDKTVILMIAPAGYGKTTLMSGWLHDTGYTSSWLSLDEEDNDPVRFLQYFITALNQIIPTIRLDLLGVLQDNQPASHKFLLNIILNEIAGRAAPFILVLDDFQAIHAPPVLELVTYLFEHVPPQMHIAILSRTDPPVPLSRMRARNQLTEIRADQLRFTKEEIGVFFNEVMELNVSSDDIIALEARTEGWIASLQLASLAMQASSSQAQVSPHGSERLQGFISAFTGSHYYIMDYLVEEVLRFQAEPVRSFLLQSSVLDRMCASLCDAILDGDGTGSVDGQAMLETLEQLNLFIIPLDSERRWYRYHHLFADVLNRRLEQLYPQLRPILHRKASLWYEANGFVFDAIRHSIEAGDLERAAHLLDVHGCLLLMRGEVVNLLHWIEAVEPYSQTLPWIAIQKAWALILTGQLDRADGPLQAAERLISALEPSDDVGTMSGAVTAARACRATLQGDTRSAAALSRQALDLLPASNDLSCSLRSVATSLLGDACWLEGNLVEAQRAYTEAVMISQAAANTHMLIIASSNLADILAEQGKLHQAARVYSETLQMAISPDGQISPLAESLVAGLSRISYEWNRLEDAEKYIQQCIELSQRWGNTVFHAVGVVMLARLRLVQSNPEECRKTLVVAEQLVSENSFTPWRSNFLKSAIANGWIVQGDLERAVLLIRQSGISVDMIPRECEISYLQVPLVLSLLRLHLARGDYDVTLALSERLLQSLDETKPARWAIEILVLRALAYQEKREIVQALTVLKKALLLAQPEGYVRTLLDEGEPMAKLLYQAKSHQIETGYAAELLSAMGLPFGSRLPPAALLIEPLTARELEVLKLIEAGCSNQEIAAKLVISMPTVKRHISNIYTKLGASSRTQAISRGKELELFQ